MGMTREPNAGHQALVRELHGVCDKFEAQGIPPIEQIAIMAQVIGYKVSGLDSSQYEVRPVLHSIMENVVMGNDQAGSGMSPAIIAGRG